MTSVFDSPRGKKPLSFKEAFGHYLTFAQAEGRSPKTIRSYVLMKQKWQAYCRERGVSAQLDELEKVDVVGFAAWLRTCQHRGKPISNESVSYYFRAARGFLNWCIREGYVDRAVLEGVRPPRLDKKIPEVLTEAEVAKLLAACRRPAEFLVVTLLLDTGVRVSELVGLTYSAINLEESSLQVFGKGSKERVVTLSEAALELLSGWLEAHPGYPDEPLIRGTRGPLTVSGVEQMVRKLGRRAGLRKPVSPHRLRHTFATYYVQNGGNVHGLKDELGHTTLEMAKRYVHLAVKDRREVKKQVSLIQRLKRAS